MHALRNIHAALAPNGILVDTQPVSARSPVASEGSELGTLDMHDWLDTIHAVDERFAETIAAALYELEHESWFVVTDTYENGARVPGNRERLARNACPVRSGAATRGHHVSRDGAARGTATDAAARCLTAHASFRQQASQQPSPRQLSRPSLSATAAMTSAVSGSAHHQPASAFAPRPSKSAIER